MENIKTKIKLLDSFNITGRGLVFAIEILEGEVLAGSLMHFTLNNKPYQLKIRGVELSSRRNNPNLSGIF